MKKVSRIIISVLLIILMLVPSSVFVSAEDVTSTTPTKQTYGPYEYYNLKDGLYTKKTVEGPNADGTYDVTIDSYTSDVKYLSSTAPQTIDIMILLDHSVSMQGDRGNNAKAALINVLNSLVNNYGVGTKYTMNIAMTVYDGKDNAIGMGSLFKLLGYDGRSVADSLWGTGSSSRPYYVSLNQSNLKNENISTGIGKKSIEGFINSIDYSGSCEGTYTGTAFKYIESIILDQKQNNPSHKQVVLFMSDGRPDSDATYNDKGNKVDGNSSYYVDVLSKTGDVQADYAIASANKLKKAGVEIYSIGMDDMFDGSLEFNDDNGLARWVTSGYNGNAGSEKNSTTAFDGKGKTIRDRAANVFLNIISSNWVAQTNTTDFRWCQELDNTNANNYYNKVANVERYYSQWASNANSWQNIPAYYTRNPDKNKNYYFGSATDPNTMASAIIESILSSISTTYLSQGSLLGDYSIKDTTSNYFDIVEDSWHTYKIPYDSSSGSYEADLNKVQYGEGDRKWNENNKTELSLEINTTTRSDGSIGAIEVPASENNASVIDSFVVKDDLVSLTPTHSGNKLRVTYKIRPKDSFMGAYSVATHDYNNSGIFKETVDSSNNTVYQAVQKFASLDNSKRVQNITPEVAVSLVNSRLNVSDDNVKIGMLYDINALGQNYSVEYDGRYSGNTYSLKYNNGTLSAYDSSNSLITYKSSTDGSETYPTDYVTVKTGGNVLGTGCESVVTDGTYIQFNSSGIKLTDGTYSKTTPVIGKKMYIAWKTIDGASTLDDIISRFNAYNATGQTDENATASQGIVNNVYYGRGFARVQQLLGVDNVNVYVPMLTVSDSVINSISGVTWSVSSNSLESTLSNFDSQSYNNDADSYNNALNAITDVNINYNVDIYKNNNTGKSENRFVLLEPLSGDNSKVVVVKDNADTTFVNDFYGNNGQFVKMSAYMIKFADKDGNVRNSGDSIKEGDKFKIILTYDSMYTDILSKQSAPFKATVDEHYTTAGECSMCKTTPFTPSFLGYDAQIHLVSNAITVTKQGCDSNHLNESFVFSLVGIKENSEGTNKDMSTAKILSNFTIQGNGTKIIPVDASEYQYFYVVEDTNAKETNGWTWDYSGVKLDGLDTNGWAGIASEAFELKPGANKSLTFTNEYNKTNEGLHYSSAYCSNILSKGNVTTVTGSHSISTNTEG